MQAPPRPKHNTGIMGKIYRDYGDYMGMIWGLYGDYMGIIGNIYI